MTRVSSGPEEVTNIQDELSVTAEGQQLLDEFATGRTGGFDVGASKMALRGQLHKKTTAHF